MYVLDSPCAVFTRKTNTVRNSTTSYKQYTRSGWVTNFSHPHGWVGSRLQMLFFLTNVCYQQVGQRGPGDRLWKRTANSARKLSKEDAMEEEVDDDQDGVSG